MTTDATLTPRVALVLGGRGFLGGFIKAALHAQGWTVRSAARPQGRTLGPDEIACDLTLLTSPESWHPLLEGVDVVVNAAGILREEGGQTFQAIHVDAPLALAQACVQVGGKRFIQLSALGAPEDGEFIASKHRFDEALAALPLPSVILRPSVVYSTRGSYGGTSLLRALAAFPGRHVLPGDGHWQVSPVAAEDLAQAMAQAAGSECTGVYEVGSPVPIRLKDYQATWRRWLKIPGNGAVHVPRKWVDWQVRLFEALGKGPVGLTMWTMLKRGNITAPGAAARLEQDFGVRPRGLTDVLDSTPSQTQDRWQAQLYFMAPLLKGGMVALWLWSGVVGLVTPATHIETMVAGSVLDHGGTVALARAAGGVDLLLGACLAWGRKPRWAVMGMLVSVLVYTVAFGGVLPGLWWDPLGGLAKNLGLLPALAVLWVLVDRR